MDNYIYPEKKCNLKLAYAYVPIQKIDGVYSSLEALRKGTLFPELNLPLGVYEVFKKGAEENGE